MILLPALPDAAAFAPFGALIQPPQNPGDRRMFSDWLVPVEGLTLQFHINHVLPSPLPLQLTQVERHPHAAQAFVPLDVSRYGVIYGGAQKNIGPAGVTFVIVRDDLLDRQHPLCPSAFNWRNVADNDSMFNTPPTLSIYIAGLVFEWLEQQGGVAAMAEINDAKAKLLYEFIDNSKLYRNDVQPKYRSCMNVPFFLRDESLNAAFLAESQAARLAALKGHKMVGGMRASIYNAVSMEAVQALVKLMGEFENRQK